MGAVHVRSWKAAYSGGLMSDEYLASLSIRERADMWRDALSRATPSRATRLVAVDAHDQVVGFAVVGPEATDAEGNRGELYVINVEPDSWGKGAGPALHESAIAALKREGFVEAVLWVHPGNGRARRFYEARGWTSTGVERTEDVLGAEVPELQYSLTVSSAGE